VECGGDMKVAPNLVLLLPEISGDGYLNEHKHPIFLLLRGTPHFGTEIEKTWQLWNAIIAKVLGYVVHYQTSERTIGR